MTVRKWRMIALAGLIFVSIGAWLIQQHRVAAVRGDIAQLRGQLEVVTTKAEAANREATRMRVSLDEQVGVSFTGLRNPGTLPKSPVSHGAARARLDTDYAGLFRRLKLSAFELNALKDLLAERSVRSWTVRRYAFDATGQGIDEWANKTEETEFIAAGVRDIDERIHHLLGEQGYSYYTAYERTLPWRPPFKDLVTQLQLIAPLSDQQLDQLVAWAAEAGPNLFTNPAHGGPKIAIAVVERAQSILTPTQMEKLIKLKASTDAYAQMMRYRVPPSDSAPFNKNTPP